MSFEVVLLLLSILASLIELSYFFSLGYIVEHNLVFEAVLDILKFVLKLNCES